MSARDMDSELSVRLGGYSSSSSVLQAVVRSLLPNMFVLILLCSNSCVRD